MASVRSKWTYTSRWDECGSMPLQFKDVVATFRPDRREGHFKTKHRSAFRITFQCLDRSTSHGSFSLALDSTFHL